MGDWTDWVEVAFDAGGEAGARLLNHDTLLRLVRSAPEPEMNILGIDDWAKRKGPALFSWIWKPISQWNYYSSAESVARWLRANPGVEIISRTLIDMKLSCYLKGISRAK